jgi:chorismate dehydratase
LNSLRIGCVKYLNARPLVQGWPGEVCLDTPAALCRRLSSGLLDVALVSSFEFLRNPIYRIVDGVSIASAGPVYSVVIAHRGKTGDVRQIEVDPASETSVNLVRCFLAESGSATRLVSKLEGPGEGGAHLLIGDRAIRFRRDHPEFNFWDLGEAWEKLTHLPFVYALWLIRPEVTETSPVAEQLRGVRDRNLAEIDSVIAGQTEFDPVFCARYYREYLRFDFGEKEKQGLRKFHRLCVKHGLLPQGDLVLDVV